MEITHNSVHTILYTDQQTGRGPATNPHVFLGLFTALGFVSSIPSVYMSETVCMYACMHTCARARTHTHTHTNTCTIPQVSRSHKWLNNVIKVPKACDMGSCELDRGRLSDVNVVSETTQVKRPHRSKHTRVYKHE